MNLDWLLIGTVALTDFYLYLLLILDILNHRISIPAYAIEQQWWQSDVANNEMSLMSLIFKNVARSLARVDHFGSLSKNVDTVFYLFLALIVSSHGSK
jgi:hypothetical protein